MFRYYGIESFSYITVHSCTVFLPFLYYYFEKYTRTNFYNLYIDQ